MKKAYAKPEIVFESFTLSTNIAGDCETITSLQSRDICGYPTRGGVVFVDSSMGCTVNAPIVDGEAIYGDRICYHVPIESSNLFNS